MIGQLDSHLKERNSSHVLLQASSSITGFNKSLIHDYNESVLKQTKQESRNKEEMKINSQNTIVLQNYTSGISKTMFDIKNLTGRYTN